MAGPYEPLALLRYLSCVKGVATNDTSALYGRDVTLVSSIPDYLSAYLFRMSGMMRSTAFHSTCDRSSLSAL